MKNVELKVFDEKGKAGIAVYKARRRGEEGWKLLYVWVDFNENLLRNEVSGEWVSKGYYMYVYLGHRIATMLSYEPSGLLGRVLLGRADKRTKKEYERHASLVTYWGQEVLKEVFTDIEVDYSAGLNMRLYNTNRGYLFPNRFIWEEFPLHTFPEFQKPEKWDRLPEDTDFLYRVKEER